MLVLLSQLFFFVTGTIFLYYAIFSYEAQDYKIQDKLEVFWLKLSDFEEGFMSKLSSLTGKSVELLQGFLLRLFGNKVISWKYISLSSIISVTSFSFFKAIDEEILNFYPAFLIFFSAIIIVIRYYNYDVKKHVVYLAFIFIQFFLIAFNYEFDFVDSEEIFWFVLSLLLILVLGLPCNMLLTKLYLITISKYGKRYPIIVSIIIPSSIYVLYAFYYLASSYDTGSFWSTYFLIIAIMVLFLVLIPNFIFSHLFLLLPIILIIGKVCFTVINRALYSVQRNKFVMNKKLLFSLSSINYGMIPYLNSY